MDIVIYGCGRLGQYIFKHISSKMCQIEVKGWIDNYYNESELHNLPVYSEDEFLSFVEGKYGRDQLYILVAIMDEETRQRAAISTHTRGASVLIVRNSTFESQLPVINNEGDFNTFAVRPFNEVIPILPYLEYQVADQCNLNCKGCMHFSNLVKDEKFADPEEFEESMITLSKKFRTIKTIRLMGGEPLLNPDLPRFIHVARKYFPYSDIRVVTNGLLITRCSEELIRALLEHYTILDITQYPPVRNNLSSIMSFLEKHRLKYVLSEPIEKFLIRMSDGTEDPETVFKESCLSKMCTFLRNKKLYVCPHIPMLYEQQAFFDIEISEQEMMVNSIDIFDDNINGWQILERLEKYFSLCRFCGKKSEEIFWESGIPKKADWIVR